MTEDTYTCTVCKGTYEFAWEDAEAKREFSDNFPDEDLSNARIVCDDCYAKVMKRIS